MIQKDFSGNTCTLDQRRVRDSRTVAMKESEDTGPRKFPKLHQVRSSLCIVPEDQAAIASGGNVLVLCRLDTQLGGGLETGQCRRSGDLAQKGSSLLPWPC